jgi:hypothetical protein
MYGSSYMFRHYIGVFVCLSRIFLLVILIFKGLTTRRLYKLFGVKGLMTTVPKSRILLSSGVGALGYGRSYSEAQDYEQYTRNSKTTHLVYPSNTTHIQKISGLFPPSIS